ncbi:AAA family ATPase [Streptomyces sp. ST2-7A]|uniref:AAA family ATPase n=1 Tax=Streptomyces sp. ST2-7A TaxID=2907214 RepID=UPI001F46040B|nr:SMC family ATPase [Streptomyces sp. ST2-7A]MCE7079419.1 SMC family ATPase [Streptomyces sp. ST2-7A]
MRLHHLTLTAFGPFAGTEHVDFERLAADGLFLLHGPTGAGKTSVLDAVCYALYGSVPGARQHALPALRSDHADPAVPTEVVLDLTVGDRRLEITRRPEQERPKRRGTGTTRDKALSLLRERDPRTGRWEALSRSHQEIGLEVGRLTGMSREQFCQVVMLPQGDFARFLRAGAEERAHLLGRLFDTGRFAAAERRLADRRAEARERLRAGDERLVSLAHRVDQAAGPCPDLAADTSPLPTADDPHCADAVLARAAVARTGARERRELADLRLAAAEAAATGAADRHARAVRLAETRVRRAAALREDRELTAARPGVEDDRERLERAAAAATVLPALQVCADARTGHEAALEAEEAARRRLPTELREAGEEHLTSREHALREEIGRLAAAREAAEEAAALDRDLATLDGEEAAALRDSGELGTALDRLRRDRGEPAAEATELAPLAARLPEITALLPAARTRRDAADRRDRLDALLLEAETARLAADREAGEARTRWLDIRERRLDGLAAELAGALRTGTPCAVCGSPDHPRPARPLPDAPDAMAEKQAQRAHETALGTREEAARRLAELRTDRAAADRAADGEPTVEAGARLDRLEEDLAAARRAAERLRRLEVRLEEVDRTEADLVERLRDLDRRRAARSSRRAALAERLERLRAAEEPAARADDDRSRPPGDLDARAASLTTRAEALAGAALAARATRDTADRLKSTDDRLTEAVWRAGFPRADAAEAAALAPDVRADLRRRIEEYDRRRAAVDALLSDPALRPPTEQPIDTPADAPDPGATGAELRASELRLRAAAAVADTARRRVADLEALSRAVATGVRELGPRREESRRLTLLAGLTAGTAGENAYRMRLETYVLAARLERVAGVAGARLDRMTAGRYLLEHTDTRSGRGRSGLGLHVVDGWTGRHRDTATLSGGESFLVSLSLALGLADVVAEEAGGVRLDTLFVDEGFGTLDEQSLDDVLDVLDSLRERNRSVGIVSHVAELRSRVPVQLEITKGRRGSGLRLRGPDPL